MIWIRCLARIGIRVHDLECSVGFCNLLGFVNPTESALKSGVEATTRTSRVGQLS